MRKIREIPRLKFEAGLSERLIAQAVSCSRSALQGCLKRWRVAGVGWPLPGGLRATTTTAEAMIGERATFAVPTGFRLRFSTNVALQS